ncbi:unnamed protein product [Bursaphelenchus okinawaensis]|uniref:Metalloendopeptidase n=1 Tax=Bursaphelenchus okinawaensis TaxID=465554 RepID=A0A811KI01_9BILA|nr:unnamed protein product [Bursaphelenchus okinawaensis]CAG9102796.1 unnamed protein product [Bursaphelenchus okinawaensis]
MILRLSRVLQHTICLLIVIRIHAGYYELTQNDIDTYFDADAEEHETVLSPEDFAAMSEYGLDSEAPADDLWDSDAMYNHDKFEGDIANDLNASTVTTFIQGGPVNTNSTNTQLNAIRDRRQLWKNGRIPYAISSQYSAYSRSVIASAMQEYATHTCIQWSPRTANDKDYVYIMPDRGCYSMVGRTGGRQTLSLGNGCIQKGIIIHEMMHAVGFFHEQSRTDRDNYITIMWNNIQPGMQGQFEKYSSVTIQTLGAEYDFSSIMHYGPKAFSRNGMPTIVPKRKSNIGQRSGFSQTDSFKINTLYECPNRNTKTVVPVAPVAPVSATQSPSVIVLTVAPHTTTQMPTLATAEPYVSTEAPKGTLAPIPAANCSNSRPDCEQLAQQGWCQRNPPWMRDNCPAACGMCEKAAACEDLRVDCPELVKRRYCITAQNFSKSFCAKSCGFCFAPPTESASTLIAGSGVTQPTIATRQPLVTFWPNKPSLPVASTSAPSVPLTSCRDKKHFCPHWKSAGFCSGIFQPYMRQNCANSCGWC